MLPRRKSLIATVLTGAFAAFAIAGPAMASTGDITQAKSVLCTLKRLGDCKVDGACIWKDATARQARRQLKVDFAASRLNLSSRPRRGRRAPW